MTNADHQTTVANSTSQNTFSAMCIAGTHSGVGKTTVTLGLLVALRRRGLRVQPFKCGPDFIDPGHHARACGQCSYNLDTWMMGDINVCNSYRKAVQSADVAVAEGVMGLFDGASSRSLIGSTAHVCKLLDIPIILVVNAKAFARSIAALVHGYATFEPGMRIVGVVANNVSSSRHAQLLREALDTDVLPPLLGCLPRQEDWILPERHLGLVAHTETRQASAWFDSLADGIEKHINMERLLALCRTDKPAVNTGDRPRAHSHARLGYAFDDAFHFYYQDNLHIIEQCGAELVPFSPLHDSELPAGLHGIYIGGGFPEMFAEQLSTNRNMRHSIREFADKGGCIYAECGGLMYLCKSLIDLHEKQYEMCEVLPARTTMESRLHCLGYVEVTTLPNGLFGASGTKIRGHEFHWSSFHPDSAQLEPAFQARFARETEIRNVGINVGNVWASYVHFHFASNTEACRAWIERLTR